MAEISKINLGHATAYGYYKAGGGTATEEEFIQLCADLGIQVEYLENMTVIVNTLEPGEPATATYENGVLTFGIPKGEQGDPAPADEITEATDAWLAENISNPSNPPLDRSLTLANAAAPADMVGDLRSAVKAYTGNESFSFIEGKYINTSGSTVDITDLQDSATLYGCSVVDAAEGDKFTINGTGGASGRLWCFIDSSGNSLAVSGASASASNLIITAPENSAKLVINIAPGFGDCFKGVALVSRVDELSNAIDNIEGIMSESTNVDLSQYTEYSWGINSSDKWVTNSKWKSYILPIDEDVKKIAIKANATNGATISLLKTNSRVAGEIPDYADGYSRIPIQRGGTLELYVPDDANYLYILKEYDSVSYVPSELVFGIYKEIPDVDDTLSIPGDAADAKATGEEINTIFDAITKKEVVDIGSATVRLGLISTNNTWSTTSGFDSYAFSVDEGKYYKLAITANENNIAAVGMLKNSNLVRNETPPYCDGITNRIIVPAGETVNIDIPSDCTYIVIMKTGSNSVDYSPSSIVFVKWNIGSSDETIPLGLHEYPRSQSALNIVKRCRQMTDIKWTPAVDLSRYMLVQRGGIIPETAEVQNYLGTFKAGTEYTGVPYGRVSSTMDEYDIDYATVGHYIDFETFISSVFNPDSKICKENVSSVAGHRSVIYASVCSGLTCYALNVAERPTAQIAGIPGLSFIGKINNNGTLLGDSNFKIGDVLNKYDYHTAIITDIIRNTDGEIVLIELSDASTAGLADRNYDDGQVGGICRRKGWTREQLFAANSWGDYSLYRYTGNVSYTPNPYINVGDEFNMQRIEHFPCMPYEGNKFTYKTGYIPNNAIKILTSLSGYGYLKVFKDGTEITGSPFAVTDETVSVDVTTIEPGEYTAYLCNIENDAVTNLTYPCKWTITE